MKNLLHQYIYIASVSLIGCIPIIFPMQPKQALIQIHKSSGLPFDISAVTASDLAKVQSRMDDWPQLNFYRQDNECVMHKGITPEVVFLGDSIFEYWNNPKLSSFFSNTDYVNRGISAQTTPQVLLRLRSDVINLKPKIMVLLAGVNDIGANTGPITLEETQGNIASIAELATLHHIKVILCSMLPVSDYHFDGKDPRGPQTVKRPLDKICALNQWVKTYAAKNNHGFIDYFNVLVDENGKLNRELSNDDLHPNANGYALMAPLTQEAIKKALK